MSTTRALRNQLHFDTLQTHSLRITPNDQRVILLPFVHGYRRSVLSVVNLLNQMSDADAEAYLDAVLNNFGHRHDNLTTRLEEQYALARKVAGGEIELTGPRRLLLGAYFTMEYSFQAVALFNPSIVPHPDQRGVPPRALRFVMSFRATGEGHVSSVVFRTGLIDAHGEMSFDAPSSFSARARVRPDRYYLNSLFLRKLMEMAVDMPTAQEVLAALPEHFTLSQLEGVIADIRGRGDVNPPSHAAFEAMLWLARSNYRLELEGARHISELVIFPHSDNESRGIEDLRLVRFTEDDGSSRYYGTYTAYNGERALPMFLETADFGTIDIHTLNGRCVQNKGMALFPRRIGGRYAMCSRIDGRNLFLMYSDEVHFWETADLLAEPAYPWEYRLMGNCGSPLETAEGWVLLTHGVGLMRQYSIGAMLLDSDDPLRVIGRLRNPLLVPPLNERDGYVPNVVYSCGALIHGGTLYLPYAISDRVTALATIEVAELLERLQSDGPA